MCAEPTLPTLVLLVDDSADDAFLLRRAFRKAGLDNPLMHLESGDKAIAYLGWCIHQKEPLPALVLLDVKMPGMDGFDTLKWIRSQAALNQMPVVMLSASSLTRDAVQSRELGAERFLTKPSTLDELTSLVRQIASVWLGGR